MSARYFDATYFCKLYWTEHGSPEVAACASGADELVCGLHGRAEFYSVGHRKLREGVGDSATLRAVFAQFETDRSGGGIRFLPLSDLIVDRLAVAVASPRPTASFAPPMRSTSPPRRTKVSRRSTPTTAISWPPHLCLASKGSM